MQIDWRIWRWDYKFDKIYYFLNNNTYKMSHMSSSYLKNNTKVILYNLNTKELNHKEGKIINYIIDKNRYNVKVEENNYNIKPINIVILHYINNVEAMNKIKEFNINDKYIDAWYNEYKDRKIEAYILYYLDNPVCFVLTSKMDNDPLCVFNDPYTLNFIYTFPSKRRKNFAYYLLMNIKYKKQLSAFTNSEISDILFTKSGYENIDIPDGSVFRSKEENDN